MEMEEKKQKQIGLEGAGEVGRAGGKGRGGRGSCVQSRAVPLAAQGSTPPSQAARVN